MEADGDWNLTYRKSGKVAKTVKARELWEQIGYAAWACADPGIQFHTTINDWHTCPAAGEIKASNPCSEYMFLDDTACNLASLNLMAFRKADGSFDIEAYEHADQAVDHRARDRRHSWRSSPRGEIAQLSYEYRTLGLGYANIGGLLMASGIPYDSRRRPRALRRAHRHHDRRRPMPTSAEMARELGPLPRLCGEPRRHAAGHPQSRAAPPHGEKEGYEGLATAPVPLDHAACPDPRLLAHAARTPGSKALELGAQARLPQRAGDGDRADRHDRPGDGLRHHRHRARFRAGEVQEARRRRLFQDHQPHGAGGAARARLSRGRDQARSSTMRWATARSKGAPGVNHEALRRARASRRRSSPRSRRRLASAFDIKFVFNKWTLGEDFLHRHAWLSAERIDQPDFDLLAEIGFAQARDRGGQRICLRRHDARRRAGARSPSICRCSTAPSRAAARASASSRSRATSA